MKTWKSIGIVMMVLAMGALGYLSVSAAEEGKSLEQMVAAAKTPADHEAIAAYYDKEAQAAHEQHAKHKKLADSYVGTPLMSKSPTLMNHCNDAATKYQGIAKDYEALAKAHREMAKTAK